MTESERLLLEALELASAGRKPEACRLLYEVLRRDLTNETAWLWLSDCSDSPEERVQALQNCLRHNPNANRARAALARLRIAARAAERYHSQVPVTGSEPHAEASGDWHFSEGANVFTVSPEALSPEEFAMIEARTENVLQKRPGLRLLKVQLSRSRAPGANDWNELAKTNGKRSPRPRVEQTQPVHVSSQKNKNILYAAAAGLFLVLILVLTVGALSLLLAG